MENVYTLIAIVTFFIILIKVKNAVVHNIMKLLLLAGCIYFVINTLQLL